MNLWRVRERMAKTSTPGLLRMSGCLALAAALPWLTGCRDTPRGLTQNEVTRREYAKLANTDSEIQRRIDIATKTPLPTPGFASRGQLNVSSGLPNPGDFTSAGIQTRAEGLRSAAQDYEDKCDLYWRLNWVRLQLLHGPMPRELDTILMKARVEAETVRKDGNYELIIEALDFLEEGLNHFQAYRALAEANVSPLTIPWASGERGVAQYIAEGRLGFGGQETRAGLTPRRDLMAEDEVALSRPRSKEALPVLPLTAAQQKALDVVQLYATKYAASPEEPMRQAWRNAIVKINRLRDNLAMTNRKENRDGDSTEVASSLLLGSASDIQPPPSPTRRKGIGSGQNPQTRTYDPLDANRPDVPIP